jgi:hypothetical protein
LAHGTSDSCRERQRGCDTRFGGNSIQARYNKCGAENLVTDRARIVLSKVVRSGLEFDSIGYTLV